MVPVSATLGPVSGVTVECDKDLGYEALDRASIWINNIRVRDRQIAKPATLPAPNFELYAVGGGRRALRAGVKWSPTVWETGQLLLTYTGDLAEGFELWAAVDPLDPAVIEVELTLRWIVDRAGGGVASLALGPDVAKVFGP